MICTTSLAAANTTPEEHTTAEGNITHPTVHIVAVHDSELPKGNIIKKTTCCFTGHRPEKLPDPLSSEGKRIQKELRTAVNEAVQNGFLHFITGLSRGIDFDAALYVIEIKKENPDLILECAIPFEAQSQSWSAADKKIYEYIKSKADINTVLQKEYTKNCYQKRNEYMVDNSSLLIAVYGGTQSGTKNCIGYARQKSDVKINMIYC